MYHGYRRRLLAVCALLAALLLGLMPSGEVGAGERWCPPETGYCAENAFLAFWQTHGALDILGYPIDHPRRAPNGQIIQFYERAVLEWHPENVPEYQVLLTRLGALLIEADPLTKQPPDPCAGDCAYFPETAHTLRAPFIDYWRAYGGLPVYGFPLTEQVQQRNPGDGKVYTVQYFERNRFEYHPEYAGTRYEVLLGRLGAELLDAIGGQVRTWPVVTVPDYGAPPGAPPPSPSPSPTPRPSAPAPASPVVFVSPSAAQAGTTFLFDARNFPAGATVTWRLSSASATLNSGSFALDPGQSNFTFTLTTDGAPPGNYTMSFSASGMVQPVSIGFSITGPPPSAAAAQFKSKMLTAIDQALPVILEAATKCPTAGSLTCSAYYNRAKAAHGQMQDYIYLELTREMPDQCRPLLQSVGKALTEGSKWFNISYSPSRAEAAERANQAYLWTREARRIILQEYGTCG